MGALTGCNQLLGLDPPETPTALRGLTPSRGTLTPAFDPTITAYHLDVSVVAQRIFVTPEGAAGLQVLVDNEPVPVGTASGAIRLPRGTSQIAIDVVEPDGTTTYTIVVDRGAIPPVTTRLASTTPVTGGVFGAFLAADGPRLIVAAPGEDPGASIDCDEGGPGPPSVPAGVVYTYQRTPGGYVLDERLARPDPATCSQFGFGVALAGDRLLVGDQLAGAGTSALSGAAYVYDRGPGGWQPTGKLTGPGLPAGGLFGRSIALADGWLFGGAPGVEAAIGRVYAFRETDLATPVTIGRHASQPAAQVGISLAADGDRLVVGAYGETVNTLVNAGSVGVHERGLDWTPTPRRLVADIPAAGDLFGSSVAIAGDRLVVGAPGANSRRGEVHVYRWTGTDWDYRAELAGEGASPEDLFGNGVSVAGDLMVTGWCRADAVLAGWTEDAPLPLGGIVDAGVAMFYDVGQPEPQFVGAMGRPEPAAEALFGCAPVVTLDRVFLGAHGETSPGMTRVGAVYVVE